MTNDRGETITDEDEIRGEIVAFWGRIFRCTEQGDENTGNEVVNGIEKVNKMPVHEHDNRTREIEKEHSYSTLRKSNIVREEIGRVELEEALKKLKANKAKGEDHIANEMLKNLGEKGKERLRRILNNIRKTSRIPNQWKILRIKLLLKGRNLDKLKLGNYRPIAITSNVYKLYMIIMRNRMTKWVEGMFLLGEFQNGFRTDRRLTDNIYVLTQVIEIAKNEGRKLYCAFLDFSKAYDSVDRDILWSRLQSMGFSEEDVEHLKAIYEGTEYKFEWNGIITGSIKVHHGLKQGCPLSPLLFALYLVLL